MEWTKEEKEKEVERINNLHLVDPLAITIKDIVHLDYAANLSSIDEAYEIYEELIEFGECFESGMDTICISIGDCLGDFIYDNINRYRTTLTNLKTSKQYTTCSKFDIEGIELYSVTYDHYETYALVHPKYKDKLLDYLKANFKCSGISCRTKLECNCAWSPIKGSYSKPKK